MPHLRDEITSPENPLVKRLVGLQQTRHRREAHQFIAEGLRTIDALLAAGCEPQHLLVRSGEVVPAHWPGATVGRISSRVADKLTQAQTCSGYLGVFTTPTPAPLDLSLGGLVLVDVHDPGNVGTLLRSAAAFACSQVVLIGGADPYSYKTVQASAGALAAVQMHMLEATATPDAFRPGAADMTGAALCALVVSGGVDPLSLAPGPRWLLVGSEAHGLRPDWVAASQERLTLPMRTQVESLNAGVAASIAMYLLSQRATPSI